MEVNPNLYSAVSDYLSSFLGDDRYAIIERALSNRTRYITVCLEDILQAQNASAVLRSAEAFGLQDVHIIEDKYPYTINPKVVKGSNKWLTLHKYNNSANPSLDAITHLKSLGYRIAATSPHVDGISLNDYDLTKGKTCIFFGNEHAGVSQTLLDNADEFLYIPMYGFTESFNISVAAGLTIHTLREKLMQSDIDWHLPQDELEELRFNWLKSAVKHPELSIKRFFEDNPQLLK